MYSVALNTTGTSWSENSQDNAGIAQLVEHFLAKEDVESSSLFARSKFNNKERNHDRRKQNQIHK